jgi:hypothetical protein
MTIMTKYHGRGQRRGARISAEDGDGNRVTVLHLYAPNGVFVAEWTGRLLRGWHGNRNTYTFITDTDILEIPGALPQDAMDGQVVAE